MKWQPIETAPKSTDTIRLWNGHEQGDGYWESWERNPDGSVVGMEEFIAALPDHQFVDRWTWCGEGFAVEPPPTHWMPLPDPPM